MRRTVDINLICNALSTNKEEVASLSDEAYEVVLYIVSKPMPPLTEKEKIRAAQIYYKYYKHYKEHKD